MADLIFCKKDLFWSDEYDTREYKKDNFYYVNPNHMIRTSLFVLTGYRDCGLWVDEPKLSEHFVIDENKVKVLIRKRKLKKL